MIYPTPAIAAPWTRIGTRPVPYIGYKPVTIKRGQGIHFGGDLYLHNVYIAKQSVATQSTFEQTDGTLARTQVLTSTEWQQVSCNCFAQGLSTSACYQAGVDTQTGAKFQDGLGYPFPALAPAACPTYVAGLEGSQYDGYYFPGFSGFAEAGTYYVLCTRSGHFGAGMKLVVHVESTLKGKRDAAFVELAFKNPGEWTTISGGFTYQNIQAMPGDTIHFEMPSGHNVYIADASQDACATLIANVDTLDYPVGDQLYPPAASGLQTLSAFNVFEFTIPANQRSNFVLFCTIGTHCQAGMYVNVSISISGKNGGPNTAAAIGGIFLVALGSYVGYRRFKKQAVPELQQAVEQDETETVVFHT